MPHVQCSDGVVDVPNIQNRVFETLDTQVVLREQVLRVREVHGGQENPKAQHSTDTVDMPVQTDKVRGRREEQV